MTNQLIPLHTHSVYSLLDSLIKIEDYVSWGKKNNMKALAITDHGSLASCIKFFKECNKQGIKPILGFEAYMTLDLDEQVRDNYHIILLAKNKTGWLNLIKLHNLSYYNFYYKPRITFEDLEKYSEGIIACSACLAGIIPKMILAQNMQKIDEYIKKFKSIFGEDFYLELQDHGIPQQKAVNLILVQLAKKYGIKLVATNDSHYTNKEDSFAHEVLLCKQTHKKISDTNRMSFGTDEFYLKNTEEMRKAISYLGDNIFAQVLQSSQEIYDKVEEYDILQHQYNYPTFGDKKESLNKLVSLAQEGFKKRFAVKPINTRIYIERLKYELETIYKIGFTDYFLVLYDLYKFMDSANIATGFGRGSGAGSLVLYCLNVTQLDPIEHKLLFERFINPERISAPDVDCDVEDVNRGKVIDYIERTYTKERVCNIATYGSLTSVASFKAVASVMEMPFVEANRISKDLLNTELSLDENMAQSEELQKMYKTDSLFAQIFDVAKRLEGGIDKRGVHAAGVVISNQPLENLTPVMYIEDASGKKINCSAFEMTEIDGDLKLLKLDILGLKNLSIVKDAMNRLGDKAFNFKDIKFDDEKTFKMITDGLTLGVFQLESDIMKHLCREIKPKTLADLSVINAGARPGALESGITQSIINRKNGVEEIDYVVDGMEEYLKETYGTFCIPKGSLINTQNGYTKIEDIKTGDKITTSDKHGVWNGEVAACVYTGKKDIRKISLADGSSLYCSDKHIIPTNRGDVAAQELIPRNKNMNLFYNEDVVYKKWKQSEDNIDIGYNKAYIIGMFLGDGNLKDSSPNVCFQYKEDADKFAKLLSEELGGTPKTMFNTRCWYARSIFNSSPNRSRLTMFLDENFGKDEWRKTSKDKRLPNNFINFDYNSRLGLLRGLWDSDGSWNSCISYKTISNRMLGEIGNLLETFKIQYYIKDNNLVVMDTDRFINIVGEPNVLGKKVNLKNDKLHLDRKELFKYISSDYRYNKLTSEQKKAIKQTLVYTNIKHQYCVMRKKSKKWQGMMWIFEKYDELLKHTYYEDIHPVPVIENIVTGNNLDCYDIAMKDKDNPYYLCNNIMVHNCYQEQLMQLSQVMAGYTMPEADGLRKIVGKKLIDKLPKERKHFIEGCLNKGHSEKKANEVFDMIEKFGRYGFNASHSFAYSALSYVTAYLKANYPLQYMTSLLNANSDNLDKLNPYIDECYRLGIDVLPPNINKSMYSFEHDEEDNAILFGFNGIKGVGASTVEPIIAERNNGNFVNLEDLLNRIPSINKSAVENLIKCGAFNTIENNPYKYLPVLEFSSKAKAKAEYKKGNISYYDCLVRCYVENRLKDNDIYKNIEQQIKAIKSTKKEDKDKKQELKDALEYLIQHCILKFKQSEGKRPSVPVLKENEMEILGFPISNNPKKEIIALQDFIDNDKISDIKTNKDYTSMYYFIGRIKSIKRTRNGSYFAVLTDDIDEITTFMKRETYVKLEDKLTQPSNYFRICGTLNKSYNPEQFDDSFKLQGIRYFNTSRNSEIVVKCDTTPQVLKTVLTKIKEMSIINIEDINYRLNILCNNKKFTTKIDYWIQDINSISSLMIEYNMTVVK